MKALEGVWKRVPHGFTRLKQRIDESIRKSPFATINEYRQWCSDCGITDRRRQDNLLRTFHEVGVLFFFGLTESEQEERDSLGLEKWLVRFPPGQRKFRSAETDTILHKYVLDPEWWKRVVSKVIASSEQTPALTVDDIRFAVRETSEGQFAIEDGTRILIAFLKLSGLCPKSTIDGSYLFARSLRSDSPVIRAQWDSKTVRWSTFDEAAFFDLIGEYHNRQRVVKENRQWVQGRRHVMVCSSADPSAEVLILARPESGELEFKFKPNDNKCLELAQEALTIFCDDCLGGPPKDNPFGKSELVIPKKAKRWMPILKRYLEENPKNAALSYADWYPGMMQEARRCGYEKITLASFERYMRQARVGVLDQSASELLEKAKTGQLKALVSAGLLP